MDSINPIAALERERQKLIALLDEAMENGIPIAGNEGILEQSRKVDALIMKIQREKRRQIQNQQER